MVREEQQRDCRYVEFDVDALCGIAALTDPSISPIREVEKLEGGFSKALRMQKEDGTELIAKIPCPNAGSTRYTTASEAAVLEYSKNILHPPWVHGIDSFQSTLTPTFQYHVSTPGTLIP